jgi:hypothetical protein
VRITARLLPALVLIALVGAACGSGDLGPTALVARAPVPVQSEFLEDHATLGLHVFAGGEILHVNYGRENVVARWPSRVAPYAPPVETRHGFVGLAGGETKTDLWLVAAGGNTCLGRDVTHGFAVSAGGRSIAYGLPQWQQGGYRTQLFIAGLPGGRALDSVVIEDYAVPIGFLGERVLVSAGDALDETSLWDPETGEVQVISGYGGSGATDPTSRRAVLYTGGGDDEWDIGSWGDSLDVQSGGNERMWRPAFSPEGRWVAGIRGTEFDARARLDVYKTADAHGTLLSDPLPGAFQPAWEDDYTTLVLANDASKEHVVYRCRADGGTEPCVPVWSTREGRRYSTWLVPMAAEPLTEKLDHNNGFAMWPEHRGIDVTRSAPAAPAWRSDPHETAEEFGKRVLGWKDVRAEIAQYEHFGVRAVVRRADGLSVQVWLNPVAPDCWSVTGVGPDPERRTDGVSVSVRGRHVYVHAARLAADSADVIVGFNGREISQRVIGDSGVDMQLPFVPRGSGYCIVLLRDFDGRVFSAAGALLYPGLVAG